MNDEMTSQAFYLLAHNEQLGSLRETEALLVRFLRESGVHLEGHRPVFPYRPFILPGDDDLSQWGDPALRRLGLLVHLISHMPPVNASPELPEFNDYVENIRMRLDPQMADKTTWYAGDRPAQLFKDHPVREWGLLSGFHINRVFQYLRTGVL
jgi:hypothetical protein